MAVLDTRTRAELYDVVLQYGRALDMLRAELAGEAEDLARETQLLADVTAVRGGLEARERQLARRRARDLTSESTIR
jgi:hypothetical protein